MGLLIENHNLFVIILIYLKYVILVSPKAAPLSVLVSMYFFLSPCSIFTSLFFILYFQCCFDAASFPGNIFREATVYFGLLLFFSFLHLSRRL